MNSPDGQIISHLHSVSSFNINGMYTSHRARIILAPAKVNIRLKITGRRPDGYHNISGIMVPIALYDHIELKMTSSAGIKLSCHGLSIPDNAENLAYRAAEAFFSKTGIIDQGVFIKITKKIPVAAGLGGGSSDAAGMLMALNEICSNPLSYQDLAELALKLGADVPFFLKRRPCLVSGIGEVLEPIKKWPLFWYVIVMPPVSVSTAWVYSNLKLELTSGQNNVIKGLLEKGRFSITDILENDLESVTACRVPAVSIIKNALMDVGAEGALMSGSGPSVFGVFKSKNRAVEAKRYLTPKKLGDIFVGSGL